MKLENIDRLREYVLTAASVNATTRAVLAGYLDGIEREVADMVPLPLDADGEPIHVGDVMDKGNVTCIRDCGKGWEVVLNSLYTYDAPSLHHHAPTVEDVLREFTRDWCNAACTGDMTNAERDAARANVVAEFAARLRMAGEE